jgi:hypothetical protein
MLIILHYLFQQQAKQLKKGANEHKLKITFNITLQGVRLLNEKTQVINVKIYRAIRNI